MGGSRDLFRTAELGGGFRLHVRRTRSFKTVTARLAFQADLDAKAAARAMVPRILGRGTERLPSLRELQIELDRHFGASLGGDTRKVGERQVMQVRADWITDRLAGAPLLRRMGGLMAEFVRAPARDADGGLRGEVLQQERKMAADEAAAVFDDKARYARYRLVEEMCRDEPYARPAIGHLEEIRAVTAADVEAAWSDLLDRAPVDLFLVGDLRWNEALRFARGFGFAADRRPRRLRRTVRRKPERVRTVRERQAVTQAKLEIGFRSSISLVSPLYPALVFMNALFGGSPIGKLFKVVREQASLCYSIGSAVERTKGLVLVHAGIEPRHFARAKRLVLAQLDALRAGEISEVEMTQARGILVSALASLRDSPGGLIEFAVERAANGAGADLERLLAALREVRPRDIARAARTLQLDTIYLLRN